MDFPAPLLGLAIGDALGMPFETAKRDRPDLLAWDGRSFFASDEYHGLNPGQWTDDTQMSVALAQTLVDYGTYLPVDVAQAYLDWFKGDCRGIGNSTRKAMEELERGASYMDSGILNATGNGTAMRASPIGVFFRGDLVRVNDIALIDAKITHNSNEACAGSRAVAMAVALLCNGCSKDLLVPQVLTSMQTSKVRDVLQNLQRPEAEVSAYVVETINGAFYAFLHTDNFSDAVEMAIRFGGDTDSVASITGALAGAHYGYEALPKDLLGQLEGAEMLYELNRELLA